MALTDINFQKGEIQDYVLELPTASYVGSVNDILTEHSSTQFPVLEAPLVTGGGSNIFIMSE
jgi:hypothetical protein